MEGNGSWYIERSKWALWRSDTEIRMDNKRNKRREQEKGGLNMI